MENANNPEYLEKIKIQLLENLRKTAAVPSVQMQPIPNGMTMTDEEEAELADLDEDEHPDERMTALALDKKVARTDEFEDSDDEGESGGRPNRPPRRSIMDLDPKLDKFHQQEDDDGMPIDPEPKTKDAGDTGAPPTPAAPVDNEVTMEDAEPEPTPAVLATEVEGNVDEDGDLAMDDAAAEEKDAQSNPIKKEDDEDSGPAEAQAKEPETEVTEAATGADKDENTTATTADKEPTPISANKDAKSGASDPSTSAAPAPSAEAASTNAEKSGEDKDAEVVSSS